MERRTTSNIRTANKKGRQMKFTIDSKTVVFTLPDVPRTKDGRASWIADAVAQFERSEKLPGRSRVWFETSDADADVPLIGVDVASVLLVAGVTSGIAQLAGRYSTAVPPGQIAVAVRPLVSHSVSADGRKRIADAQRRRWAKTKGISAVA